MLENLAAKVKAVMFQSSATPRLRLHIFSHFVLKPEERIERDHKCEGGLFLQKARKMYISFGDVIMGFAFLVSSFLALFRKISKSYIKVGKSLHMYCWIEAWMSPASVVGATPADLHLISRTNLHPTNPVIRGKDHHAGCTHTKNIISNKKPKGIWFSRHQQKARH